MTIHTMFRRPLAMSVHATVRRLLTVPKRPILRPHLFATMRATLSVVLFAAFSLAVSAQPAPEVAKLKPAGFPDQPIEYTVVYPAGGGVDITARLLAKYAEQASGDKILVNNRTGGAGMVGHAYLAKQAKPDGYTLGVVGNNIWGDAMLKAQGKWALSDLEAIAYLKSDSLTWLASTTGPFAGKTAKEIIQVAKDKPSTVRIAVIPGTMWEYLIEQVETQTGAKFLRVPFQGGKPAIVALLGGNVDIAQGFRGEFDSFMQAKQVTPIGVASATRLPSLADVPTFNEMYNGQDYIWRTIHFVVVPKGTPTDRKAYLAATIQAAMRNPELIAEYQKLGAYFDQSLTQSKALAADLDALAQKEREFYVKTGRLKP